MYKKCKHKGFIKNFTGLAKAVILLAIVAGILLTSCSAQRETGATSTTTSRDDTGTESFSFSEVTDVAKQVSPSVVSIGIRRQPQGTPQTGTVTGIGSGVIYRRDGYIITNNHVVSGATDIVVILGADEVGARLIAADADTDIAVIKVDRNNLNAAKFGSVKDLQVGDPVVAIGSPFGFEHTVTFGIISALNRNLTIPADQAGGGEVLTDLIQTDAAINPGNSGGALSNTSGQVIGINTLIVSGSGAFSGIGFAIPADTATNVADQLIKNGRASHPYIGITGRNVGELPLRENAGVNQGVLVIDVVAGGPAARAGLRRGDIITSINGEPVEDIADLIAQIREHKVGDTIELTYVRNGARNTVKVTLAERPEQ
ncbi:MAG: trypsin-like peptidase domain-containing protein [Firmicutes bacterium]|nr:trypsin-like peptidase domain-containing protein [Bacillota bacterium]